MLLNSDFVSTISSEEFYDMLEVSRLILMQESFFQLAVKDEFLLFNETDMDVEFKAML